MVPLGTTLGSLVTVIAPTPLVAPHIDVPVASTLLLWAGLLAVALAALAGLALLARRQNPSARRSRRRRPSPVDCARLDAEAQELGHEAAVTAQQSQRAAIAAQEAQADRARAQETREAAGRAYDAAQQEYERVLAQWRTGEAERISRVPTADEEERDHEVSRAALAAYRRGDLSVDELREVFRRTSGWDPLQEQRVQEVARLRSEAYRTHRVYDAAVAAERIAAKAATVAMIGARALAEESAEAVAEARAARALANECVRALRSRRVPRIRRSLQGGRS